MIYVFAPDADGCLFHQAYRKSIIQDVVAHNHELLNFVAQQAIGFSQFVVLVGSNRQSQEIDEMCRKTTRTESVFSAISAVSAHLEATLDTFLLADIFFDRADGKSFESTIDPSYKAANFFYIDHTKLILLYAQMHHIANLNPREKIIFDFYDDRGLMPDAGKEILEHLDDFFSCYPDMIPFNVSLRLNHYGRSQIVTHLKQIDGTGIVDENYRNTVKSMYQMTIQAATPTKNGLIYSACHVRPALLACRRALMREEDPTLERKLSPELHSNSSSNEEFETIDLEIPVTIQSREATQLNGQERSSSLRGMVGSSESDVNFISVDLGDKSSRADADAVAASKKTTCCCFRLFSNSRSPSTEETKGRLHAP